jgi:hypothetical protein
MVEQSLRAVLLLLHVLAGAAWFGSIFYSIFVLYPRLAAMSLVALSGVGLLLMPMADLTGPRLTLIGTKIALTLASAILFWRVSWHWWPARLFALPSELPALHRRFRIGAACMLALVGSNMALGVLARAG